MYHCMCVYAFIIVFMCMHFYHCMCVYAFIIVCMCMHVSLYVCMHLSLYLCVCMFIIESPTDNPLCVPACIYLCLHVCTCACMHVSVPACIACMYLCLHVICANAQNWTRNVIGLYRIQEKMDEQVCPFQVLREVCLYDAFIHHSNQSRLDTLLTDTSMP
jgi:hypothetical protein